MSEEQLRAQFDAWAKSYVDADSKNNWNLIHGHDMEDFYAFLGFEACAKIKDAEIEGLKKQLNAMVTSDVARNQLIEWRVSEGVKAKTKELESLSSERDANSVLTNENEALKAQVEKMREALSTLLNDTQHKDHDCGDIEFCPVKYARDVLESTHQSFLADHDRAVEIKVLEKSIYCTVDQIRAMIEARKNKS
jgi:hypothetical protein